MAFIEIHDEEFFRWLQQAAEDENCSIEGYLKKAFRRKHKQLKLELLELPVDSESYAAKLIEVNLYDFGAYDSKETSI